MSLAQAMEHLVEGISSTTAARNASLSNLGQEVKKHKRAVQRQMKDIHNENRSNARELKRGLTAQREHLASEEKSRQNTAQQESEQRRVAKSELRSNTYSFLSRSRLQRKETSRALREKMTAEIHNINSAANDICKAAKSMLGEIAADLRGAHAAWASVKKNRRT